MKKIVPTDAILIPDDAELVFDGVFYSAYHWQQTLFDGTKTTFEMLKRRDTAVVIGVADNKVIIVDEDQPHSGKRTTFPAGSVELSDADIRSAAEREMKEETGYIFNNWRLIKLVQPANDIEWFVYIWLATDVKDKTEQAPDPGELIAVKTLGFSEAKSMVMSDDGALGKNKDVFEDLNSLSDLLNLPEYTGQIIDR